LPIAETGPLEGRAIAARGGLIGFIARPMRSIHSSRSSLVFERIGYFFPFEVVTTNWKNPSGDLAAGATLPPASMMVPCGSVSSKLPSCL
jgi:hypothetical protein